MPAELVKVRVITVAPPPVDGVMVPVNVHWV